MNISVKRIKKICLKYNLYPNLPKRDPYKGHATHDHPCSALDNFVDQDFEVAPRCVILTDITYLHYGPNKRTVGYLCCFKDAYTKEILGYSFDKTMNVSLVKKAYRMMMDNHAHELKSSPLVYIHSDQGSQYLSTTFKQILSNDNFIQSCSNRGNSQDNAPMESFFARLKTAILSILDLCPDFETAQKLVYGYLNNYNTTPQYNLAALSPKEFYTYITTGVYPLDSYYGVKATELRSLSKIVDEELRAKYEAKKARRLESKKRRDERAKLASAFDRCDKDEIMINRQISKFEKTIKMSNKQIKKFKEILEGIKKGKLFIVNAVDSIKELLRIPSNWRLYPELDYVNQMKAMF